MTQKHEITEQTDLMKSANFLLSSLWTVNDEHFPHVWR